MTTNENALEFPGEFRARLKRTEFYCKLSTPELRKRQETVLASLKKQVLEKKELLDGFAYRFEGTDEVLDELLEFIKSERECCDCFIFDLSISGDKGEAWLMLTGVKGVKEFIAAELKL
ncbi:MAG TPA: hypothetical protein VIR29_00110 [Anseongella sp.]